MRHAATAFIIFVLCCPCPSRSQDGTTALSCDQAAASPLDKHRPTGIAGVTPDKIDPTIAIPACEAAAKASPDDPRIMYQLARAYDAGKFYESAQTQYAKAADQGYAPAQNNLGAMYASGRGVAQDYAVAVDWYRKAADQGYAPAQNNLGAMYANGRGVAQDYAVAVDWYRKAADQGLAIAQNNLGEIYRRPNTTPGSTSGPFDGRWSATVGPQGACNFTSILILDVVGSSIVGNATNPHGVFPLSGTVNRNGTGVFKIGGFVGTVRFSGTTFEANYANQCGGRFAIGTKRAAGPFDGRWSATVGPQGRCNFTSILILDVVGSSIVGNATNPHGVFPLSGTVNVGMGVFKIAGFVGTVRFSETNFEAHIGNSCGGKFAIGTKRAAGP